MAPLKEKNANGRTKLTTTTNSDVTPLSKENFTAAIQASKAASTAVQRSAEAMNSRPPIRSDELSNHATATSTTNPTNSKTTNENNAPTNPLDETSDIDSDQEGSFTIQWNCNQIRSRITQFINNTSITQTDFQHKLHISAASYRSFMRQNGPHAGSGTATYAAAHQFFAKREAQGLKMPRATTAAAAKKSSSSTSSTSNPKAKERTLANAVSNDSPLLPGEAEGTVPIFDTCNDIRRKIEAHQRKNNLSMAAFARLISDCQGTHGTTIQGKQITDFLRKGKKHGPMSGNTSKVFYASYVYFEKMRVKDKKAKGKKRLEMESEYGSEGVDTKRALDGAVWTCAATERPYVDNLGQVRFVPI